MTIPLYNFDALHNQEFREKVLKRFSDILEKNSFVEGDYNYLFEEQFAKLQQSAFCRLVANGTDALEIAIDVYGIKPGEKIGVPGITFYASAEAIMNKNCVPVLIDVNPETGLICPDSLDRMAQKHDLKGVIPVHIFGLPAPMAEIEKVCDKYGIKIIEDAAQAQGTFYDDGKPVGSRKNLTTFSFYPTKNLSAFGDAGCIMAPTEEMADKICVIRNHGRGEEAAYGRNSRCDHLQAAVLHLKLENCEQLNQRRKVIAGMYFELMKDLPLKLLPEKYINLSSWHLYPIHLKSRDERRSLENFLRDKRIGCVDFYMTALSQEKWLADCEGEKEKAEAMAGTILNLPIHPFLTDDEVKKVAQAISEFYN